MPWTPPPALFGNIDCGKDHAGFSIFREKQLDFATELRVPELPWPNNVQAMALRARAIVWARYGQPLGIVVVEYPEIRSEQWRQEKARGTPGIEAKENAIARDLIDLAHTGGAIAHALLPATEEAVSPSLWKSNVQGDMLINERIKPKLSPEEGAKIVGKPTHNVWDSIGIGLWRIGRLHPNRR